MTVGSAPTPPKGYELVFEGNVQKGDLAHSDSDAWNPPGMNDFMAIGKKIVNYYAVARPKAIRTIGKP